MPSQLGVSRECFLEIYESAYQKVVPTYSKIVLKITKFPVRGENVDETSS